MTDTPPDYNRLSAARSIMRAHGPWSGARPETRLLVVQRLQQAHQELSLDQCAALLAEVSQENPPDYSVTAIQARLANGRQIMADNGQPPTIEMLCSDARYRELATETRNLLALRTYMQDIEVGILKTALGLFDLLGAGHTIVADKETP